MFLKQILMAAVIACSLVACTSLVGADEPDKTNWALKTEDQAVRAALATTGFSRLTHYQVPATKAAELVVLEDDQTPFLHNQINGRQLWHVEVQVKLELKVEDRTGATHLEYDTTSRKFDIYLDPRTGNIIKMVSGANAVYEHKPPLPSADTVERVLSGQSGQREIYHDLPAEPPGVDFLEAMRSTIGHPFLAREIHVSYLTYSKMDSDPRPVWIIDLRGIPPRPGHPRVEIPIEQLNHMRSIVDARTGRHLGSGNSP